MGRVLIPIVKYVGGEDGWLVEGEKKATESSSREIIQLLSSLDPRLDIEFDRQNFSHNKKLLNRQLHLSRRLYDQQTKYLWLMLKRRKHL